MKEALLPIGILLTGVCGTMSAWLAIQSQAKPAGLYLTALWCAGVSTGVAVTWLA